MYELYEENRERDYGKLWSKKRQWHWTIYNFFETIHAKVTYSEKKCICTLYSEQRKKMHTYINGFGCEYEYVCL